MVNKTAKEKQRITEGSNVTRPGATIILTQPQRFGIGLDDYMQSIRGAENVDFTRRVRLYDIYSESLMDPHLFSVVQKRKSGVLGRKIEFRRNGVADDKVNRQIASPWFLRFLGDALDAEYWGFTLVQFYINEKGWIDYYLVPRKHVDPVLRVIKTRQDDLMGEPFDNYADLLMIRGKEPLGILARTAPYVIYKRGTTGPNIRTPHPQIHLRRLRSRSPQGIARSSRKPGRSIRIPLPGRLETGIYRTRQPLRKQ